MNKVDIEIGNSDIPISIYSAVEQETRFNQFSNCCKASVSYNKVCADCGRNLEPQDIFKGLIVGDEIKPIDTETIKVESGNLKILGIIDDLEDNGVFKDGTIWFIGTQKETKNKAKTERNLMKFSYFRDAIKSANISFLGLISLRGKEHIVILKNYFNCLLGLGVYAFDRIRDIKEIPIESYLTNQETIKQMSEQIKLREKINIKDIENTREKLIEMALNKTGTEIKDNKEIVNPLELISF